jgi:hypothetical protein
MTIYDLLWVIAIGVILFGSVSLGDRIRAHRQANANRQKY